MIKEFPAFSKLTLKDRAEYESLIKDYPPVGDISFPSLIVWWGSLGGLAVSRLNCNLVISYWLPGDEEHSGLSLVGIDHVDESICAIFDFQRERGDKPKLVNVPDFVVNNIRYPELFKFVTGAGEDEYLLSTSKFAVLENTPQYMRIRARKFIRKYSEHSIEVKNIDLKLASNRRLLLDATEAWPLRGINNINKLEREVLPVAVANAMALGLRGVGLYLDDVLQAFCLYYPTKVKDHSVISHARANYDLPYIFDYVVHSFSDHLQKQEFKYMNIHADNGSQKMRALKIALKPEGFFRKYAIEPR